MIAIKISGNEKPHAEMNRLARNSLINILWRKGIEIPELEEEIERAYEYYYDRREEIESEKNEENVKLATLIKEGKIKLESSPVYVEDKKEEYQRKQLVWENLQRMKRWDHLTGEYDIKS